MTPDAAVPDGHVEQIWLTAEEAAARARVGKTIIYSAVRSGRLKAARPGGRMIRTRPAWVDRWLESCADETPERSA